MNQRDAIRKMLDSLPFADRAKIEAEVRKYRIAKPLDMEDLWATFKAKYTEEAPLREAKERKRKALLKKLT